VPSTPHRSSGDVRRGYGGSAKPQSRPQSGRRAMQDSPREVEFTSPSPPTMGVWGTESAVRCRRSPSPIVACACGTARFSPPGGRLFGDSCTLAQAAEETKRCIDADSDHSMSWSAGPMNPACTCGRRPRRTGDDLIRPAPLPGLSTSSSRPSAPTQLVAPARATASRNRACPLRSWLHERKPNRAGGGRMSTAARSFFFFFVLVAGHQ